MPNIQTEDLPKMQKKLTVTISVEEAKPYLEKAAEKISKDIKIKGFRPGKATYEMVSKEVGEMKVYEAALESIVRKHFTEAILKQELDTIGPPQVDVKTLVPGNDIVFEATVNIMPAVTKLADWKTMSIKGNPIAVTDKEIEQSLKDLTRMQTKEVRATKTDEAGDKNKLSIDLDMKQENVPIEGGQAKGTFIYMDQESYLPGLKEQLRGMKEGDKKEFKLTFPKEHFQKMLAGKEIDVTATVNEIFHLEPPTINDEFAKSLGLKDEKDLHAKINENIGKEKATEENRRQEKEMLEEISKKTSFDEIPENLIQAELEKMLGELKHNVTSQGLDFEQYLASIKKTAEGLVAEMKPQAELRIKVALILKQIAKDEGVQISDEQVDKELDTIGEMYQDKETRERIFSPEYREYKVAIMKNQQVIDLIKKAIVK